MSIIEQIQTKGCSAMTNANPDGVDGSRLLAKQDMFRANHLENIFASAEDQYGISRFILMGIASRESRMGLLLNPRGYGDRNHAYGMMQIDIRSHVIKKMYGPCSPIHVNQAAEILLANFIKIEKKFPLWDTPWHLKGAIAAYNFGIRNVVSIEHMDIGTTHNDYSSDVWERSRYFLEKF